MLAGQQCFGKVKSGLTIEAWLALGFFSRGQRMAHGSSYTGPEWASAAEIDAACEERQEEAGAKWFGKEGKEASLT